MSEKTAKKESKYPKCPGCDRFLLRYTDESRKWFREVESKNNECGICQNEKLAKNNNQFASVHNDIVKMLEEITPKTEEEIKKVKEGQ